MIAIIDYGSGNIHAIAHIYHRLNIPYIVSRDTQILRKADKLILPGVGDFDETMLLFRTMGLKDILNELVLEKKVPILGVCVGMQVLGESSEEGSVEGFGWIKGHVKLIPIPMSMPKPYLPHMGWNSIDIKREHNLLNGIDSEVGFYFLHSYYFKCANEDNVLASTDYGIPFSCAINHNNVYGVQFHPEKSHKNGIELFRNFANL